MLDSAVVFQVDSLLVCRQMARFDAWACRSPDLVDLRDECRAMGAQLDRDGVRWEVQHIYREFNQSADSLANLAVDEQQVRTESQFW